MKPYIFYLFIFSFILPAAGQTVASARQAEPKNPRALLAAAAPYYDFTNPALKPWHLKASYQLYDDHGRPSQQGTFEYWWASPKEYRTTWMRGDSVHTDWHTSDGKHFYEDKGDGLHYFEYKLQSELLSPLPDDEDVAAGNHLERTEIKLKDERFPCVMVIPPMTRKIDLASIPSGLFPTYCFDPHAPALRDTFSMVDLTVVYNDIVKIQDRFLARQIAVFKKKTMILTASVDQIGGVSPSDPVFTPNAHAKEEKVDKAQLTKPTANLIKSQLPTYPSDAKIARISGTVVLHAMIGRDGEIHDLRVVTAPWPSLAASALWAASHWEYKPYLLNGQPVPVETTINVVYSLGY